MCTHHHCSSTTCSTTCSTISKLAAIHNGIARFGWTAAGTRPDEDQPGCIYTLGLTTKHLPELYIEGDPGVLTLTLAGIVEDLLPQPAAFTDGFMIEATDRLGNVVEGMLVDTDSRRAAGVHAIWGDDARLMEVFLPSGSST